jgi:type I restriction enzyme R subunit
MTPEARAHIKIDAMLEAAGWIVQSRSELNLHAGPGVAVREVPTPTGPADYVLYLGRKACSVLEGKPEGVTLLGTAPQGTDYAAYAPSSYSHSRNPLPFTYLSTGSETLFRDGGDSVPVLHRVLAVHRPESLRRRLQAADSFRARLAALPPLDATGLRACQAEAIAGVEASLRANQNGVHAEGALPA